MFQEYSVYSVGPWGTLSLDISWGLYILFISFFSLVNMVGAIIGYWTEKEAFIERFLRKGMNTRVGGAVVGSAEKWAAACGWIGFGLILAGILLPWGTYSSTGEFFQTGLTSTSDSYLMVGSVAALTGLLGSLRKASSVFNAVLGGGGLVTVIGAGGWISIYYSKPSGHSTIFAISVGPFVTLIGGACAIAAAVLYALHARTQATP